MTDQDKVLAELHEETINLLLGRIKDGSATAAELSVARSILRDNGINSTTHGNAPIAKLEMVMPFDEDDPEIPVSQAQ